jgi:hypothetical protein
MEKPGVNVFISYAHKDAPFFEVFKEGVKSHLSSSDKFNFITWEDSDIPLGSNWDEEIQKNLGKSGIAILCVSSDFLGSRYIRSDEFESLMNKYPDTLILPVYFNHCNIKAWNDLSQRQFFKPGGVRYNQPDMPDFAFCDLLDFNKVNGSLVPSSKIALYFEDFVRKIETTLSPKPAPAPAPNNPNPPLKDGHPPGVPEILPAKIVKEKNLTDKIVESAIIAAIVFFLGYIFYSMVFDSLEAKKFNSIMGGSMFLGSCASFIGYRKFNTA